MNGVASKVFRDKQITLDIIQNVAYEVICSSFLLNLINEGIENENNIGSGFAVSQEEREDERTKFILEKVVGKNFPYLSSILKTLREKYLADYP